MRSTIILTLVFLLFFAANGHAQKRSILIYTKNGKGYVHDNIASAVEALKQIAQQEKFKAIVSEDPAVFTEENLKNFSMLVFPSTNNDVFDTDEQRLAFRRYIEAGGGLVGIHSITGTERNWTWFKMFIGCTFSWHANFQKFTVRVTDPQHPSMKGVPLNWERSDELYFGKELYPVTNVMMSHQISTLDPKQKELIQKNAGTYSEYYPAAWYNRFQGGHAWITTLGHSKESYSDPVFVNHLQQGIRFVAEATKGVDFSKSYAQHKDDPILK
jgi:type 1 glutamine amidotransferase